MSERDTLRRTWTRVRASVQVTGAFTLNSSFTQGLLDAATDFWKQRGVTLQEVKAPKGNAEPLRAGLRGEGGSIWSISFDNYKKKVAVFFRPYDGITHVALRIELPWAYRASSDDVGKANQTLEAFEKRLHGN